MPTVAEAIADPLFKQIPLDRRVELLRSLGVPEQGISEYVGMNASGPTISAPTGQEKPVADLPDYPQYPVPEDALLSGIGKGAKETASLLVPQLVWSPQDTQAHNPYEAKGKTIESAAEMFLPISRIMQVKGLAEAPWLIKSILGMGLEGGKTAGLTAVHGGTPEEITRMGVIGAGGGAFEGLPGPLNRSAARGVARAVRAEPGAAKAVEQVAPDVLAEGGFVGGLRGLADKAAARKAETGAAQQVAASSTAPLDMSPAVRSMQERTAQAGLPQAATPAIDEGMLSALRRSPPSVRAAILKGAGLTEDMVKVAEAQSSLPKSGYPAGQSELAKRTSDLESIQGANPDGTPLNVLSAYRRQANKAAKQGGAYSKLPGTPVSPYASGSKAVAEDLNTVLHDPSNPATARLVAADKDFHTWKTVSTSLERALPRDIPKESLDHFTRYILGRMAIGAVAGGAYGGSHGHLLYGVGGGALIAGISGSTLWQSMSAQAKANLAQHITSGNFEQACRLLEAAAVPSQPNHSEDLRALGINVQ